jgi:hypothetical protein
VHGVREEVRVYEDGVGGSECGVGLEEECGGDLGAGEVVRLVFERVGEV